MEEVDDNYEDKDDRKTTRMAESDKQTDRQTNRYKDSRMMDVPSCLIYVGSALNIHSPDALNAEEKEQEEEVDDDDEDEEEEEQRATRRQGISRRHPNVRSSLDTRWYRREGRREEVRAGGRRVG